MRALRAILWLGWFFVLPLQADETRFAKVTYLTASSVYVDAGRSEGVRVGDRIEVIRGDEIVSLLQVKEVSNHRAVCSIVERNTDPAVGDLVRFVPVVSEASVAPPAETETSPARPRGSGVRGRVGLRYLVVDDRSGQAADFSQPALDLRLDSAAVAGTPWGFSVDARARRTYRTLGDGSGVDDDRTRLYRMAVSRRSAEDPWSFTAGRQYSASLATISIFDGVSAEYSGTKWAAGLLSGTQPDREDFGVSGEVQEHGFYFRFHGRPSPRRGWRIVTGLIGSYADSEVNREFLYVQGRYNGPKLSVYLAEEIDYNRGWKEQEGADTVDFSSSFISLRYQAHRALSLRAGFDNRRNVRLFRDRVTPITEFDDSFRRGAWAGAGFRFLKRFRIGLDARTNRGETAGDSEAYSMTFGARRLTPWNFDLNARSSRFENRRVEGWLHALDVGVNAGRRVYLRLGGGTREEDNLTTIPLQTKLEWYGLDLDVSLGRHWFLLLSAERTDGDLEQVDQYYTTVTYRF